MPEIERDGTRIYFMDQGDGPACLLIHGHTLDHRVWDAVAPPLLAAGRRLIRPDLRGHGSSAVPSCGYHWSHHAADMARVMDETDASPVLVVGFSLGGGVALELALTMPERVKELVLIAPVMPDRPFEADFMDNLREVARTVRSEGVRAAMAGPWAQSPLFAASMNKPGVRRKLEAIVRDFPGAEYLATERDRVDREWKLPDRLGEIAVPTHVMVGELEMSGFRAFADEAASGIPGATLDVIEGCGHLLPLEAPEKIAEIILGR
jgi:3-oxoadipate enol-lactonase